MKLIEPTMEYEREIQDFRLSFLASGDSMDGCGALRRFDKIQDWLAVESSQILGKGGFFIIYE